MALQGLKVLEGFSALSSLYRGFILDQFGVMHNGKQALPGAIDCIEKLHGAGHKLIVLSNSPQNEETTLDRLEKLGFNRTHFVGAVTSGSLATPELAKGYVGSRPLRGTFGRKCVYFTWAEGDPRAARFIGQADVQSVYVHACGGAQAVSTVEQADFLLAHGTQAMWTPGSDEGEVTVLESVFETGDTSAVNDLFRKAVAKGLKMVCVNPDRVTVSPEGTLTYVPGQLGHRYAELGGEVVYFGKPYPAGFRKAIETLGLPADTIVHVGDSLDHDIKGAHGVGIASVLVAATGVHAPELGCGMDTTYKQLLAKQAELEALCSQKGETPTHVVPSFAWTL